MRPKAYPTHRFSSDATASETLSSDSWGRRFVQIIENAKPGARFGWPHLIVSDCADLELDPLVLQGLHLSPLVLQVQLPAKTRSEDG